MCQNKNLSEDDLLKMASQERPISREELGIQTQATHNDMQVLNEGFNFLQFSDQNGETFKDSDE